MVFYAVALTLFFILLSSCDSGLCCFVGSIIPGGVLGVSAGVSAPLRRNYVRRVALEVGSTELRSMGCAGGGEHGTTFDGLRWGFRPPTTDVLGVPPPYGGCTGGSAPLRRMRRLL